MLVRCHCVRVSRADVRDALKLKLTQVMPLTSEQLSQRIFLLLRLLSKGGA